jgi:hypothetical protein
LSRNCSSVSRSDSRLRRSVSAGPGALGCAGDRGRATGGAVALAPGGAGLLPGGLSAAAAAARAAARAASSRFSYSSTSRDHFSTSSGIQVGAVELGHRTKNSLPNALSRRPLMRGAPLTCRSVARFIAPLICAVMGVAAVVCCCCCGGGCCGCYTCVGGGVQARRLRPTIFAPFRVLISIRAT